MPLLGPSAGGMTATRDLGPDRGPVRRPGQGVLQDSQPREGELIDAVVDKAATDMTIIDINMLEKTFLVTSWSCMPA